MNILTGVTAPAPPPTNPLLNTEFNSLSKWKISDTTRVSVTNNDGLSGNNALKIALAGNATNSFIFQESQNSQNIGYGRKFHLHLRKGSTYTLTFMAKAEKPGAIIKAKFEKANEGDTVYWTSEPIAVETTKKEYKATYTHKGDDVQDMRLTISFEGSNNTVYFDKVVLKSTRDN